jgi:hypothetical protein
MLIGRSWGEISSEAGGVSPGFVCECKLPFCSHLGSSQVEAMETSENIQINIIYMKALYIFFTHKYTHVCVYGCISCTLGYHF